MSAHILGDSVRASFWNRKDYQVLTQLFPAFWNERKWQFIPVNNFGFQKEKERERKGGREKNEDRKEEKWLLKEFFTIKITIIIKSFSPQKLTSSKNTSLAIAVQGTFRQTKEVAMPGVCWDPVCCLQLVSLVFLCRWHHFKSLHKANTLIASYLSLEVLRACKCALNPGIATPLPRGPGTPNIRSFLYLNR